MCYLASIVGFSPLAILCRYFRGKLEISFVIYDETGPSPWESNPSASLPPSSVVPQPVPPSNSLPYPSNLSTLALHASGTTVPHGSGVPQQEDSDSDTELELPEGWERRVVSGWGVGVALGGWVDVTCWVKLYRQSLSWDLSKCPDHLERWP